MLIIILPLPAKPRIEIIIGVNYRLLCVAIEREEICIFPGILFDE
ncbi:hypothetical protein AAHU83_19990 [Klebsiella pneumoniae]